MSKASERRIILGAVQRDASAKLVRDSFQTVTGGEPRDVEVTVQTPEGCPVVVVPADQESL
jgi:hypothetical protein